MRPCIQHRSQGADLFQISTLVRRRIPQVVTCILQTTRARQNISSTDLSVSNTGKLQLYLDSASVLTWEQWSRSGLFYGGVKILIHLLHNSATFTIIIYSYSSFITLPNILLIIVFAWHVCIYLKFCDGAKF